MKPLMNRQTKQVVPLPFPHPSEVERVFFSPDGSRFLSWCQDHMFRLVDVKEVRLVTTSSVAPGEQKALAVSADFKRLMGTFGQAEIHVYDVEAGTEVKEIKPEGVGSTDALAFGGESNIGVTARFRRPHLRLRSGGGHDQEGSEGSGLHQCDRALAGRQDHPLWRHRREDLHL